MKVTLDIEEDELDGDYGSVPGLRLICTHCGHSVEVFGTELPSAQRGAVMMREECPQDLSNYYDVSHW